MESAVDLYSFEPPEQAAWVLGNEATGVSPAVAQYITRWVRIPMPGPAESQCRSGRLSGRLRARPPSG